jgi:beta-phosphoglucomutase-like phosphatase (HAD superfamily)
VTDIEAAHAAGVRVIGYADKAGKAQRFAHASAVAIAGTTHELAAATAHRDPYARH